MINLFVKKSARTVLWIGVLSAFLFAQPLQAEKPEILERAWQEYQFLSMETAQAFFLQVQDMDIESRYLLEAKVGLAMISQFREQNGDLDAAERLYQEVLAENPPAEMQELIHSFLADLYISRGETEQALELLNKLIDNSVNTVVGQDALIRKIYLTMGAYGSEESLQAAKEAEEIIANLEIKPTEKRPYILPLLHSLLGDIYFWANRPEKAVEHYVIFSELANALTTSYGSQSSNLYRVAKLYEQDLKQPKKAGEFYKRLVLEYPNSGTSYYALEKAAQLGAISREEVRKLKLSGLTPEILDELFANVEKGGN